MFRFGELFGFALYVRLSPLLLDRDDYVEPLRVVRFAAAAREHAHVSAHVITWPRSQAALWLVSFPDPMGCGNKTTLSVLAYSPAHY